MADEDKGLVDQAKDIAGEVVNKAGDVAGNLLDKAKGVLGGDTGDERDETDGVSSD